MVAGGVTVDVCRRGCGGVWFDIFELNKIEAAGGGGALEAIGDHPDVAIDHTRKRLCPRCGDQIMMRRFFSRKRTVRIDECPACGGQWLDGGELARIHAETRQTLPEQSTARGRLSRAAHQYLAGAEGDKGL